MREAQSAGHWIGNHTLTHSVALGDRPEANYAREEIEEAQDLIGSCSRADKLFRPYGRDGLIGPHLLSEAALTGPPTAAQTGRPFRPLVRKLCVAWTPRRKRLGGAHEGAAVDDGGMGPRPAPPNDPAASAPCRLVR